MSSKTKDQNSLNFQLINFGITLPCFLSPIEDLNVSSRSIGFCGKGKEIILNHYIIQYIKYLDHEDWDEEVCNLPIKALVDIHEKFKRKFGFSGDLT
jgi:hypothetical protein